jgi:protease I
MAALDGKRIAFVVAQEGVEQVELTSPWEAIEQAGGRPVLVSEEAGKVQAFNHLDRGDTFTVDETLDDADPAGFDALLLPGGVANPDRLRMDDRAVAFVRAFVDAGKPVAAICHAPWLLAEAGCVEDMRLTSWPSLRTDLRNAGATWEDSPCVVDGWLVTSRKPDDLAAFNEAVLAAFAG